VKFFTIGYGGRSPTELVGLLKAHGVATLVDVRGEPTRANMGSFAMAKTPDKGIAGLLGRAGIGYVSVLELGNPFKDQARWRQAFERWFRTDAAALLRHLEGVPQPFALMCCEKEAARCHREIIANVMVERGDEVEHLELTGDELARLDANVGRVLAWRSGQSERRPSSTDIAYDGDRGIIVRVAPKTIEIRHPSINWQGAHTPTPSTVVWRRIRADAVSDAVLAGLLERGIVARRRQFRKCRYCGHAFPPEHRHETSVCHGCAEHHLGIVY
jgi:hypothetical protein